jgi:serine/threonine protein kinase
LDLSIFFDAQGLQEVSTPTYPAPLISHFSKMSIKNLNEKVSLEDFVIIKTLGEGSHGFVRLCYAKNDQTKVPVVVKYVLRSRIQQWCRCEGYTHRIPFEVAILHDIGFHPNIIQFLSFSQDEFFVTIVTEYKEGVVDLFEYIERTRITEGQIKHIFYQALVALAHIHSLGIVHRDIKDENFLIDTNGVVTLIDFGSAQYIQNGPFLSYAGTSLYKPPELFHGVSYEGTAQDIWQMGILLHILMFRRNPFENEQDICTAEISLRNGYSSESHELLHRLLDRDISNRLTAKEALLHPWLCTNK